jgi:serine/threonine-protein kinase
MIEELGRYEILEGIGQGGFAVVYRARDKQLDRLVALKELRPVLLNDRSSVKDFRQEARNIARLDHPNVVTIYDVYEIQQRLLIVMQLVDGPSLAELIATQGHLSWSEAVEIITALAAGLDYAHTRNILHRDLKPANILLDSNHGPM